jgi:hypothetical protein
MLSPIPKPDKPAWGGPKAGITQSIMIRFLECPFRFYLYAVCGLQEPEPPHENLIWGDILHKGLEHWIQGDSYEVSRNAMHKYMEEEYPVCPASYRHTTSNMLFLYPREELFQQYGEFDTEIVLEKTLPIITYNSRYDVLFRGKTDFVAKSKVMFGDHKCKGVTTPAETQEELMHDLQMNLYGLIMDIENWMYDLIKIPEKQYKFPDRGLNENIAQWITRVFYTHNNPRDLEYGFPIKPQIKRWISQIPHFQSKQDMWYYFNHTTAPIALRMIEYWDLVTDPNFDPNDPKWYGPLFYQSPARLFDPSRTDKFKPHFHGILTEKIDFSDLIPVPDFYAELPNV